MSARQVDRLPFLNSSCSLSSTFSSPSLWVRQTLPEIVSIPTANTTTAGPIKCTATSQIKAQDGRLIRAIGPRQRITPSSGSLVFTKPKPLICSSVDAFPTPSSFV